MVWFSKKIIFEVQCSPIHPDEIRSRNTDYASQGYQVIWVLHDQRYNQWKISAAEHSLSLSPHYYTNIDATGHGFIYDQGYLIRKGMRWERREILTIDFTQPSSIDPLLQRIPPILKTRVPHWPLYFSGDLLHQWLNYPENFIGAVENEKKEKSFKTGFTNLLNLIFHFYDLAFRILLEKVCK